MRSRVSSLLSLSCVVSCIVLAACAVDSENDPNVAVCDLNPETAIQPQAGYVNAGYINAGYVNAGYINAGYINGVQIQGVALEGMQINGEARVGAPVPAVLADGRTVDLVIAGFERTADSLAHYTLEYQGENVCGAGSNGVFVPGVWDAKAARHDALVVGDKKITTTFACVGGVIAKCIVWGYAPWKVGADLHETCTRMARADYCGSGVSFTKDGTYIDVYDTRGVQSPITDDPSLVFEAGWGPHGAVCVSRTRYQARDTSGASVLPGCWSTLPTCNSFEEAKAKGATVGNSSRIQSRTLCAPGVEPMYGLPTGKRTHKPTARRCNKDSGEVRTAEYGRPATDEAECRDTNPGTYR